MSAQKSAPMCRGSKKGADLSVYKTNKSAPKLCLYFLDQNSALFEILTVSKGRCH